MVGKGGRGDGRGDRLDAAFAALADPTRRDIVARLAIGDASVGELAAAYPMSLQAVSKHIGVLAAAGLVDTRREGRQRRVTLRAGELGALTGWIERHQQVAQARYARLDAVLADLDDAPDHHSETPNLTPETPDPRPRIPDFERPSRPRRRAASRPASGPPSTPPGHNQTPGAVAAPDDTRR